MAKRKVKTTENDATKVNKGIREATFTPVSAESATSIAGIQAMSKSLTPQQCYELSIAVRSAIQAIATNISKAELRFFSRKTGEEIVDSEINNFFSNPNTQLSQIQLIVEIVSWYNISGEFALGILTDKSNKPLGLQVLNPFRLSVSYDNILPSTLADVKSWVYQWDNGTQTVFNRASVVFAKNFNPYSAVRGLPPLLTGVNEISSSYYASRYNKQFFENGCIPSHILVLPKGTPKAMRDDIERRYLEQYSIYQGNAQKVMVVSGDDIKIQTLDDQPKDAQFLEMSKWNNAQVAQLYKVPASTMGIYDKARFETANIERKMFFEDTLLPQMNLISETFQTQIIDRYFPFVNTPKRKTAKLTKTMEKLFKQASIANPKSDVIVILDPDTVPIMSEIKKDYIAAVKSMATDMQMSVNEAADFMGMDIPYSPARDRIYVPSNFTLVANTPEDLVAPQANPAPVQPETEVPQPIESEEVTDDAIEDQDEQDTEKSLTQDMVKSFVREYRKLVLTASDSDELFSLEDADTLAEKHQMNGKMKTLIRKDYLDLSKQLKDSQDKKRTIKDYFNLKNRAWIKSYLLETVNEKH